MGSSPPIQNIFSPGDEVLVPLAGFFSERWRRSPGLWAHRPHGGPRGGQKIDADGVADALAEHPVKAVLLTHSETSTGVIQPMEELARVANMPGAWWSWTS